MSDDQALTTQSESVSLSETESALRDIAGQLAPRSRRVYRHDAEHFASWVIEQGLTPELLTKSHMIAYRAYLQEHYAKSTAARMLSVARRLLAEQVDRNQLQHNPANGVRGFKGKDETTHVALTPSQAQELLDAIDTKTLRGQRDYVLILLLLRTGIRRSEAAALKQSDLTMRQGHHVAIIEHGKGDQRRIVKIPVDVWREIDQYLLALYEYHHARGKLLLSALEETRTDLSEGMYSQQRATIINEHTMTTIDPLFVQVRRGDHPLREVLSDRSIATIVKRYAKQLTDSGMEKLSPHGLRASFITLTLEAGASLHQVQYAAGHHDPRTTERYQKRKLNLDDNAVDKLHLVRKRKPEWDLARIRFSDSHLEP